MIISMPDSWVKMAIPQPTTSAGRTQGWRSPLQPRLLRFVSCLRSSSSTMLRSSGSTS